jgi:hypothetical protein
MTLLVFHHFTASDSSPNSGLRTPHILLSHITSDTIASRRMFPPVRTFGITPQNGQANNALHRDAGRPLEFCLLVDFIESLSFCAPVSPARVSLIR